MALVLALTAACNCGGSPNPDAGTGGGSTAGGSGGGSAGGAAGGTAGGSAGGTAGGSTGGSGGGSAGADAGSTALLPRLIVASRGDSDGGNRAVYLWNNANTLTSDVPAPVSLGSIDSPPEALAASPFNLFVAQEAAVHRYALPRTIGDGGAPAGSMSTALTSVNEVQLDDIGALWLERSPGEVLRLDNAGALSAASAFNATYSHPFGQIFGFAFEQTNNRLFAAQVSGAGLLVWNMANTRSGDAGTSSFALSADSTWRLELAGNRLYASFFQTDIKVWNGIGTASSPRAFDFALSVDAGSIRDQRVFGTSLVVTVQPTPSTGRVLVYTMIQNTFANRAPDLTIDHASLSGAKKAVLGADGTLYVLDADGVSIFSGATSVPVFKTELKAGLSSPTGLLLIE